MILKVGTFLCFATLTLGSQVGYGSYGLEDIKSITREKSGKFKVVCKDNRVQTRTKEQIAKGQVCGKVPVCPEDGLANVDSITRVGNNSYKVVCRDGSTEMVNAKKIRSGNICKKKRCNLNAILGVYEGETRLSVGDGKTTTIFHQEGTKLRGLYFYKIDGDAFAGTLHNLKFNKKRCEVKGKFNEKDTEGNPIKGAAYFKFRPGKGFDGYYLGEVDWYWRGKKVK